MLGVSLGLTPSLRGQINKLEVDVRPTVTDTSMMWDHSKPRTPGEGGHGKVYAIVKVDQIKSEYELVKPVNEPALVALVLRELDRNGFREFNRGERPEILLTVSYGRARLHNPYYRGMGPLLAQDQSLPTSILSGMMGMMQLMDQKGNGYEMRMQKSQYETLNIRITAWAYPSGKKSGPKMLWKTYMAVDDPDHRDLNAVAAEMLAAGAPYFDKQIDKPEAEVFRPLPDTHVNVGTPEVVGLNAPKSK